MSGVNLPDYKHRYIPCDIDLNELNLMWLIYQINDCYALKDLTWQFCFVLKKLHKKMGFINKLCR